MGEQLGARMEDEIDEVDLSSEEPAGAGDGGGDGNVLHAASAAAAAAPAELPPPEFVAGAAVVDVASLPFRLVCRAFAMLRDTHANKELSAATRNKRYKDLIFPPQIRAAIKVS